MSAEIIQMPGTHAGAIQVPVEDLQPGDFVKVSVGHEGLWFEVLAWAEDPGCEHRNALICRVANESVTGLVFDGRTSIDKHWVGDTARRVLA